MKDRMQISLVDKDENEVSDRVWAYPDGKEYVAEEDMFVPAACVVEGIKVTFITTDVALGDKHMAGGMSVANFRLRINNET